MSYTPWQPPTPPPPPDRRRPLITLVILIVAIVGLVLLGLNYLRVANTGPTVILLPTPTVAVAGAVPTPGRTGGLNGPQPDTVTPTPQLPQDTPLPTQAAETTTVPPSSPSATPLSPAESALLALEASNVPARDLY